MDLDSYILRHSPQWDRLQELCGRGNKLTGAEADELVDLYQRTATHLSVVRSTASDPVLEARLSALVANARSVVTGSGAPVWQVIGRFFTVGFPAAVYRARSWWISVGAASVLVAGLIMWRMVNEPGLAESLLDDASVKQLVEHDFADYYSENPAVDFAFQVWLNNARVTALCLMLGIVIIPVIVVLWTNMENLGITGGYMLDNGRADIFFGLLLPHGLLELTAIFVAAGAGLRLGWSWIVPGPRSRSRALAEEGRALGSIALGLAVVLLISGLVEGFVTPSTLPAWARLAIGAFVWVAFLGYVFTLGRAAARAGVTGDVDGADQSALDPTVAE
ncbi:MAG: stage II sporulation protein M [Propionibacteriaceae bacterium]